MPASFRAAILGILLAAAGVFAQTTDILVETATGSIDLRTTLGWSPVRVTAHCFNRNCRADEIERLHENGMAIYRARPSDGVRVDLLVTLPYTSTFQARTRRGSISLAGLTMGGCW